MSRIFVPTTARQSPAQAYSSFHPEPQSGQSSGNCNTQAGVASPVPAPDPVPAPVPGVPAAGTWYPDYNAGWGVVSVSIPYPYHPMAVGLCTQHSLNAASKLTLVRRTTSASQTW